MSAKNRSGFVGARLGREKERERERTFRDFSSKIVRSSFGRERVLEEAAKMEAPRLPPLVPQLFLISREVYQVVLRFLGLVDSYRIRG